MWLERERKKERESKWKRDEMKPRIQPEEVSRSSGFTKTAKEGSWPAATSGAVGCKTSVFVAHTRKCGGPFARTGFPCSI